MVAPWYWVIDIVVWTDFWPSIAETGCDLICVGAGEKQSRKVYASGLLGDKCLFGSMIGPQTTTTLYIYRLGRSYPIRNPFTT
jgi:hypothetical protein